VERERGPDLDLIDSHAGALGAADFIMTFGTRHWTPAELASALFKRGLAPLIVTTGGPSRDPERASEGQRHRDLIVASGVPANAVVAEVESAHTLENVTLARPLVLERIGEPRTAIAVVKWYHRRALILLAQHMPSLQRIYAADYAPFNTDRGIALTRETWEDSCPRSVDRESGYLREWQARGVDLLTRADGGGWIRTQADHSGNGKPNIR